MIMFFELKLDWIQMQEKVEVENKWKFWLSLILLIFVMKNDMNGKVKQHLILLNLLGELKLKIIEQIGGLILLFIHEKKFIYLKLIFIHDDEVS